MRTRSALVSSEEIQVDSKKAEESAGKGENLESKKEGTIESETTSNEVAGAMSPGLSQVKPESPANDVNNNEENAKEGDKTLVIPGIRIDAPEDGKADSAKEADIDQTSTEIKNDADAAVKSCDASSIRSEKDEDSENKNISEGDKGEAEESDMSSDQIQTPSITEDGGKGHHKVKKLKNAGAASQVGPHPLAPAFPFPPFPPNPNPALLLGDQLQSEFARSLSAQFYNSLSLLASQTMMNVKQEPADSQYQGYNARSPNVAPPTDNNPPMPPRADSRNSEGSAQSYERSFPNKESSSHHSYSPALSGGSDTLLQRPPSGLSPKSLAEQLRNNDSASMVVSRQQKFTGRNGGYVKQPYYPPSDGETPPPVFPTLVTNPSEAYASANEMPVPSSNMTSSPSLHHFTTRYTVESPADPSRLGVELVLDHDNEEPVIEVECGGNRGLLYVNKLCQGSKGQSIHFNDEWLTPNEFQFISGRETAKDWKRSIRHCGKSLKTLMTKGILQVHPPVCECNQCRGLHSGSKLLAGKKLQQKDNISTNNPKKSKNSPSYVPDQKLTAADMMTRHGFDGGLSSIISQLHKANGFDATESSETLDLSTKTNHRDDTSSPGNHSRKRSRNGSPSDARKMKNGVGNGDTSPIPKRPYSRQDNYGQFDGQSAFPPYLLSPEEQYRRMLALLNRSLSPGGHQTQMYNLTQGVDPLPLPTNFNDYSALHNSLRLDSMYESRSKGKYGVKRGRTDHMDNHAESGHAYDLSRKPRQKTSENSGRKSGYAYNYGFGKNPGNKHDKNRKSDRTPTPSTTADSRRYHRPDPTATDAQKYIALEARARENREDPRSWSNKTPDASHLRSDQSMIDLNLSGSSSSGRLPDWYSKQSAWSTERDQSCRKEMDWRNSDTKASPSRSRSNGSYHGFYPDNHIILDRIPISKNPVTTLHHRPPANGESGYPGVDHPSLVSPKNSYKPQSSRGKTSGDENRKDEGRHLAVPAIDAKSSRMPMLDLQKHAVPMMSLTHSKRHYDDTSYPTREGHARARLSNASDQEIKDISDQGESSSRRQSSSAPPPHLSSQKANRSMKRPTSAQGTSGSRLSYPPRTTSPLLVRKSRDLLVSKDAEIEVLDRKGGSFFKERNAEIQEALDDMRLWSPDDVCDFVKKIDHNLSEHIEDFRKHEIDGEGLPLLTERHLMDMMDIKLGHALKLIARVRRTLNIYPESVTCCHHSLLCHNLLDSAAKTTSSNPKVSEEGREVENIHEESQNGEGELKIDENNNEIDN